MSKTDPLPSNKIYILFLIMYLIFIIFGLANNSIIEIFDGLIQIITNPDVLISDYVKYGGVGGTLVSAALLGIALLCLLRISKVVLNGATIMGLMFVTGFAFFGKNIMNVMPSFIGVWLYSKYHKKPFTNYMLFAILGTSLAPVTNHFTYIGATPSVEGFIFGFAVGIFLGFILPAIAPAFARVNNGYNLYNIGFTTGIISLFLTSLIRSFGAQAQITLVWSSGNNLVFAFFLYTICVFFIIIGIIFGNDKKYALQEIYKSSGRLVSDYYILYKEVTFINIGVLGILFTSFILIVGADLSGPTVGTVLSAMGFGALGKHLKNVIPVIIGAVLSAYFYIWEINSPSTILAIIFSTCLAPISGHFGWKFGIVAGFLHVSVSMNIGYLNGGLNLYSNGFAGGFVALFLVPLIESFKKGDKDEFAD